MKMKRIITLLLALVMAATAVPMISVAAAEDERLTLNVGESLALDEISGSTAIAAEADGNKFLQVSLVDYNSQDGLKIKFKTVPGVKNYFIQTKVRITTNEKDMSRTLRNTTISNCTRAWNAASTTYMTIHTTDKWVVTGYHGYQANQSRLVTGGWVSHYACPLFVTPNDGAEYVEIALFYENKTGAPFEIDDFTIGYFEEDGIPGTMYTATSEDWYLKNDLTSYFVYNDKYKFKEYFKVTFDGDVVAKDDGSVAKIDGEGTEIAWLSGRQQAASDVDGTIRVDLMEEDEYLRIDDMTAETSGAYEFDKPLDTGIYTLSGDFKMAYFQSTGTGTSYDAGIHKATVTVADLSGNMLGSFEINPWWDKDEITFAIKEPVDGIKLTMTQNGITDTTDYKNTVDIKGLKLTLGETFNKEVPVSGGLLNGLKMYFTDSTRIVTDDRDNSFLHIGERNYEKGQDGVFLSTGVKLEALTEYTIAVKARQSVGNDGVDLVALNIMPLSGTTHIKGYRSLDYLGDEPTTWTRTHKDMPYPSAINYDSYHGHFRHSGYGYAVVPGNWETYLFSYIPAEDINSFNMSIHTSYASGAPVDAGRRFTGVILSNGTEQSINNVNPMDIDDIVIYKSASATPGTEIYEWDFENGMPAGATSAYAQTANAAANKLSLETGEYYSIIGENGGTPKMTISGFDGFENGKYSISFDVRIGAYDGDIDKDHNTADITLKAFRQSKKDPSADLIEGAVKKQEISAEWTTITYEFNVKSASELEKLVIGFEARGEGYTDMLNRIDYRNFSMTLIPTEISDIPYNGILMLLIRKRFNEKGDGNYLPGVLTEENLQYWNTNGQTLEVKTVGEGEEQFSYLAASGIKNNYSGFIYENGKTLKPGTYLLRVDLRTSVEGEDTQLRVTLGDVTKKLRVANEWVTFESVFDIKEETPVWLRFRGGPLAFYRQSFDIANLTLINLDELERGQTIAVGGNLFPTGNFEDPTVRFEWDGNANENYGWGPIQASREVDKEGNGYLLVTDRAVNHQNLTLNTGVRIEKGRTYTIKYRIRTADHRSDSGMRVSASTGSTWYKLKVDGEGAEDYASSWYNSYAINGRWKEVTSTYIAEGDGTLKIRFSGDTSAKSIHDLEIDDIQVYMVFSGK